MTTKKPPELEQGDKFREDGRVWVVDRDHDRLQSEEGKLLVHVHEEGNPEIDTAYKFDEDEQIELV